MLPRRRRLRAEEVREVLKSGRSKRGKVLLIKTISAPPPFRCAVVVSKKVAPRATVRNVLRRSIYRALSEGFLPPSGHAVLLVQSTPTETLLADDIRTLLHV